MTRVFNLLGADISELLMGAGPGNETGFWESIEAYEIHERLLAELGHEWLDVSPLPDNWINTPAAAKAADDLLELLRKDFDRSRLWVMKDPRMCRLAPLWRLVLNRLDVEPSVVIMVRHPDEVAASLKKMVGDHHRIPGSEAYLRLLWTTYLLDAERDTREMNRTLITYDQLLADWRGVVRAVQETLNVAWPRSLEECEQEIDAFLSVGQRHHETSACEEEVRPGAHDLAKLLYKLCAKSNMSNAIWDEIGRTRADYDKSMTILGPGFEAWTSRLTKELGEANGRVEARIGELTEMGGELYQCRLDLLQQKAELKQVHEVLDEQVSLVSERSQLLYEQNIKLQQRDAELDQVKSALQEQHAMASGAAQALSEQGYELNQVKAESEALGLRVAAATAECARLEAVLSELRAKVASRRWLVKQLIQGPERR